MKKDEFLGFQCWNIFLNAILDAALWVEDDSRLGGLVLEHTDTPVSRKESKENIDFKSFTEGLFWV